VQGGALVIPYADIACHDGYKSSYEIGVDCGTEACGVTCGKGDILKDQPCDIDEDCKPTKMGAALCRDLENKGEKKCIERVPHSCKDIKELGQANGNGKYDIYSDEGDLTDTSVPGIPGHKFQVYCHFNYDSQDVWTLVEMWSRNQRPDHPFDYANDQERYPRNSNIGQRWESNQDQPSRLSVKEINTIFKHSKGYYKMRYGNNQDGYSLTDQYGHPDGGKHILDKEHKCSHKKQLNMALANRNRNGNSYGFCYRDGQTHQDSNCVCGDNHGNSNRMNKCSGQHGNLRRYGGWKRWNRWCSGFHTKCRNSNRHFAMGDSYSCDSPGQRHVGGHMWMFYNNAWRGWGGPCTHYAHYGCYGSRWIA